MAPEDLNSIVVSGMPTKAPVYDSTAWSFLEIAVRNGGSVVYVVLHVPDRLRRTLYYVGPGQKVLARGALAYCKSPTAAHGQHVIKVQELRPCGPGRRLEGEASAAALAVAVPPPAIVGIGANANGAGSPRKEAR
jgi:hypothetical protein